LNRIRFQAARAVPGVKVSQEPECLAEQVQEIRPSCLWRVRICKLCGNALQPSPAQDWKESEHYHHEPRIQQVKRDHRDKVLV